MSPLAVLPELDLDLSLDPKARLLDLRSRIKLDLPNKLNLDRQAKCRGGRLLRLRSDLLDRISSSNQE